MENLNEKNRNKEGIKVGLAGLAINLLLSVFKVTIGIIANSQSIMVMVLITFQTQCHRLLQWLALSSLVNQTDREHPYGHQRFEYIAGFVMALIMGVLGLEVLKTSIANIIEPQTTTFSMLAIFVRYFQFFAKGFMAYMYDVQARKLKSDMLLASRQDSLNDMMTTAGVRLVLAFNFGLAIPLMPT
ncbi:cation transporter [Erysipelothrix sp. D19-032]